MTKQVTARQRGQESFRLDGGPCASSSRLLRDEVSTRTSRVCPRTIRSRRRLLGLKSNRGRFSEQRLHRLLYITEHSRPLAALVLPEEPHRRIPGTVAALELPSPVRHSLRAAPPWSVVANPWTSQEDRRPTAQVDGQPFRHARTECETKSWPRTERSSWRAMGHLVDQGSTDRVCRTSTHPDPAWKHPAPECSGPNGARHSRGNRPA